MIRDDIQLGLDLTGWINAFQRELDAALADMMQTCSAVQKGTYTAGIDGQRIGIATVVLPETSQLQLTARERATQTCFLTGISRFISFLDKLIASAKMFQDGIVFDRDISVDKDLTEYLNTYIQSRVAEVAHKSSLNNPKKLGQFSISPEASASALAMFQLRRVFERERPELR